jgi:hypothetical protein
LARPSTTEVSIGLRLGTTYTTSSRVDITT